jgi:TolB protein
MHPLARVIAALAILSSFAVLPAAAQAAFPGKNGKIAFATDRSGVFELYVMNADGSAQTPLLSNGNHPLRGVQPAWSPDGRKIAFKTDAATIAVVDANGSNARIVASAGVSDWPSWSPDSTKLALNGNGFSDIYTVNADGSGLRFVASGLTPEWSPNGREIAFGGRGVPGIYTVKPDGTDLRRLTDRIDDAPSWSPDGQRLTFERVQGGYDVMTMSRDGTGITNVTNSPIDETDPSWSPDGRRITFDGNASSSDVFHEVFIIGADGSDRTRLTNLSPASDILPDWQPIQGLKRSDYKNANQFCKAEQAFLGNQFGQRYRNFGQCVSHN